MTDPESPLTALLAQLREAQKPFTAGPYCVPAQAIRAASAFVELNVAPCRCDHEASSECRRCTTVALGRWCMSALSLIETTANELAAVVARLREEEHENETSTAQAERPAASNAPAALVHTVPEMDSRQGMGVSAAPPAEPRPPQEGIWLSDAQVDQVMNALESDNEQTRCAAFEMIQKAHEPTAVLHLKNGQLNQASREPADDSRTSMEDSSSANPDERRRETDAAEAQDAQTGDGMPPVANTMATGQEADQRPLDLIDRSTSAEARRRASPQKEENPDGVT